jgi:hypothetical protein
VQVQTEIAIRGGVSRKHHVLTIERFEFQERDESFVNVSPCDAWLCEVVTGQGSSRRPLTRSSLFKLVRDALLPDEANSIVDVAAQDDRMQDLGFEDSVSSSSSPPAKKNKRSRNVTYRGVVVRQIKVPANPSVVPAVAGNAGQAAVAADREILAAIKLNKLFIDVNALSWLVCFLRCEFEAGFVPAVVSAPATVVDTPGAIAVWWDFRDECWVGRERPGSSGDKRRRQRKSVRSRMAPSGDLHNMTFEAAKAFCYDELVAILKLDETEAMAAGLSLADGETATDAAAAMS